jgi:hypothetical protein
MTVGCDLEFDARVILLVDLRLVARCYHARRVVLCAVEIGTDGLATSGENGIIRSMIHDQSAIDEGSVPLERVQIIYLGPPDGGVERDIIMAASPLAEGEVVNVVHVLICQRAVGRIGLERVPEIAGPDAGPGDVEVRVVCVKYGGVRVVGVGEAVPGARVCDVRQRLAKSIRCTNKEEK